jgi:APA family basic amino acid/polyamine antiporter
MEPVRQENEGIRAQLGLWDATSIIVGIIIGVGIFKTPQEIFAKAPGPWEAMGIWFLGGVLALIGAFCFAELASTYPRSGGEYVYLSRAFGSLVGFLFAWAQLAVIRPAGIAALAFIFANEAHAFVPALPPLVLALAPVILLTLVNILGVTLGANTQNFLTAAKILGLAAIVIVGLFFSPLHIPSPTRLPAESGWFAGAMILVLWTYAGWHEAAYIASEVKDNRRNLPLSLILGTLAVTLIYLLVNGALLLALGFEGARTQSPAEIFRGGLGKALNLIIMVSALGAMNGMIFTTSRIFSAFGKDHRLYTPLAHWSRRFGTPVRALLVQGILGLGYLLLGALGEGFKKVFLEGEALANLPELLTSDKALKNLEYWIELTAAVFWCFFLLTGIALFVLRAKDPDLQRPFRTPLYPALPLIFCGWCAYMVYGAVAFSPHESLFGFLVLLAGLPLYYLPQKRKYARVNSLPGPLVGAGRDQ